MTSYLCNCIGVSKSGYYNYLKNENKRKYFCERNYDSDEKNREENRKRSKYSIHDEQGVVMAEV